MTQKNRYQLLRQERLLAATKPFMARGKSVPRCDDCQLASFACICAWLPNKTSRAEFILLMHRDEILKPTNTGRLIADCFPEQTHAFAWHRTEPPQALLDLLADSHYQHYIVFPESSASTARIARDIVSEPSKTKPARFILLDGTWKQGGRMFHLSAWLEGIPCISLPDEVVRRYAVRKSEHEHYLSTAEAAALCLMANQEPEAAELLIDYFDLFNLHYVATRNSVPPELGELHERLSKR